VAFRVSPARLRHRCRARLCDAVTLERLTLEVESVGFDALAPSGGGGTFDPAHPPPGYTLCHGGHCHAEDGRLVPYADVEAELAGGGGGFSRIVTLGTDSTFDLLDPARRGLSDAVPSNELPRTSLRQVVVRARSIEVAGVAEAETLPEPRELYVALTGTFEVTSAFDLTIGDDGLGAIALDSTLVLDGTLLDGVDFASLPDEELATTSADGVLGTAVLGALGRSQVSVKPTRR
jgi:hypothetical protein